MQDKVIYEYAILRLVPKVEREEFFNIGVIVYARQKRFLELKFSIDAIKLKAMSCDIDIQTLNSYLHTWELICKGGSKGGAIGEMDIASRFRWLVATRSTVIQSSKTHPGLCVDPKAELEELFEKYVM
ncbi:Protein of unknown function [Spirosomataceae bacterium TFI 002]|nr:Protein of unknown function [Spirosomataceae bacterium TFI 002]